MTEQEVANLIALARRAPLQNMNDAEAVAALLQKFTAHFTDEWNKQAKRKARRKARKQK